MCFLLKNVFFFLNLFLKFNHSYFDFSSSLAARVGRKRGKMNLEKTINKNMFNISSALHNANPLVPQNIMQSDSNEQQDSPISTPISSILANPKQKLTTQFKRAITSIKQRSDLTNDPPSAPTTPPPHISTIDKSFELTSSIEESNKQNDNINQMSTVTLTPKSQSFVQIKPQSTNQILSRVETDINKPSTATILTIDPPIIRPNQSNSPSARIVKQGLQQIHSSILQTMNQHHPVSPTTTSSSATLSPTSSTTGTGEVAILETIL